MSRALLFSVLFVSAVGCRHRGPSVTPSKSAQPVPQTSAPPGSSTTVETAPHEPDLVLDAAGTKLDGNLLAPPVAGKLERIDPLITALKDRRSQAAGGNAYRLSVQSTSNVLTFKSTFQTAAFAGWPRAHLQTPSGPLLMSARVPMPPDKLLANPQVASSAPVVLVARASTTELWMNALSVSAHLPPSEGKGGLGISGLTPETDIRVRVSQWDSGDMEKVAAALGTYCRKTAPCPQLALVASNDIPVSRLLELLHAVRRVCNDSGVSDCEVGFRINEPPAPGKPPDAGAATARLGTLSVSGMLPPAVIQRTIRDAFGPIRECYQQGQGHNPQLRGKITVRFVIGRDGKVSHAAQAKSSTFPDEKVVSCVLEAFKTLKFPEPEGGIVTVEYPLVFEPE